MTAGAPCIVIEDAAFGYGRQPVQQGVSAEIRVGEIFAIAGDSGAGKSTLLKAMVGLLPLAAGSVRFTGPAEARAGAAPPFGILFQGGALWTSMSVLDNVIMPMQLYHYALPGARPELARFKLALVGLSGMERRYPDSLSGGMKKRAGMARALALDPQVLFLDEPTAGLDPLAARRLDALVAALRDGLGITVVMVTHDLDTLYGIADRMLFLDGESHRPAGLDTPAALAAGENAKLREFLARRPAHGN